MIVIEDDLSQMVCLLQGQSFGVSFEPEYVVGTERLAMYHPLRIKGTHRIMFDIE
jgi:hypothetical protein